MKKEIIKQRIKNNGLIYTLFYYLCRIATLTGEKLVHLFVRHFGGLHENYIVFKNRQQQDFTDNARALFEYLYENGYSEKYKLIWLVSSRKSIDRNKYKNVTVAVAENKFGWTSPRAFYYGCVAKYFFYTNNTANLNRSAAKGQLVVNLWHGCGYKDSTHKNNKIKYSKSMEMFDLALVPGELFVEAKARYWECDRNKILGIGYPRYDWLLQKGLDKQAIMARLFGTSMKNRRLILWMPTFRNTAAEAGFDEGDIGLKYGIPVADDDESLQALDKMCGETESLLVIKRHPLQASGHSGQKYKNIKFMDNKLLDKRNVLLYHFIAVSDALISDYSSVAVDYILLDRPIGFAVGDMEQYKQKRGFIFENPTDYMPGEMIYTFNDLKKFILDVCQGVDRHREERHRLLPVMHNQCENYRERMIKNLGIKKER
ncbi:MAG: CDP-glycerol glycerophosphotransferase family protein [Clostridium sp.]|nr:CDP-glycerol glycerophosphotransferase family protein [Clostridium sp.]MCM1398482.1 CDP-glycerol glycerophosphotransferase family protein [Clostridium sp.]MCM1460204.1 CDP-glycerol glycerophosphotransferase family protein [Bacteroides sp.]